MSNTFGLYSSYYDLLYKDKDYNLEVDYIDALIKENLSGASSILELGCGTGKHAELFHAKGYSIHGVDFSSGMLARAKEKSRENLSFELGDVRNYRCDRKFDIVVSLFHVASYQESDKDIRDFIETAFTHLNSNGLFIFDFWHGPAVLNDRPERREKILENDEILVNRTAVPTMFEESNLVNVHYDLILHNKKTNEKSQIVEDHRMRYLFLEELSKFLNNGGFELIESYAWLTKEAMSNSSWNGVLVAKKKDNL